MRLASVASTGNPDWRTVGGQRAAASDKASVGLTGGFNRSSRTRAALHAILMVLLLPGAPNDPPQAPRVLRPPVAPPSPQFRDYRHTRQRLLNHIDDDRFSHGGSRRLHCPHFFPCLFWPTFELSLGRTFSGRCPRHDPFHRSFPHRLGWLAAITDKGTSAFLVPVSSFINTATDSWHMVFCGDGDDELRCGWIGLVRFSSRGGVDSCDLLKMCCRCWSERSRSPK